MANINASKNTKLPQTAVGKTKVEVGGKRQVKAKGIKILQTNLQRKARAYNMAYAVAKEKEVNIIVAGEPNITTVRGGNWIKDKNNDIVVFLTNRRTKVRGVTRGKGRITLDLDGYRLTCCYISPNIGFQVFRQHVEEAFDTVEEGKEVVILGDINAKSPEWGSPVWDNRGMLWVEWLGTKGMEVLNDGKEPTWRRGEQSSFIDVTCATRGVARKIIGWKVLPDESLSDHAFVFFEVQGRRSGPTHTWGTRPVIDEARLESALREELSSMTAETPELEQVTKALKRAQEASEIRRAVHTPILVERGNRKGQRERIAARRVLHRQRRQGNNEEIIARDELEYKNARRTVAGHIRASKRSHWRDICEELEDDIWGKGYQIVTKTIKGGNTPYEMPHEKKIEIARQLFPGVEDEGAQNRRGGER